MKTMEKETKYFMAGTDEEVLFGDVISQTLVKDFGDGRKIRREVEFTLDEETLPHALEMGIIEEENKEELEDNDLLDFEDDDLDETLDALIETQEEQEKRMDAFEEKLKVLKTLCDSLYKKSSKKQPKNEEK